MARFDLIANVYDLLPIPTHSQAIADRLAGLPGPRLDIGGGTGRFTVPIHANHRPVLVDASPGMLSRARRAGRELDPVCAVGQRLPFPDGTFQAITITEALHHFAPHQAAVLAEAARVLKPDGRLVIEEIDPRRLLGRAIELGENILLRFGSEFLTPDQLAAMAEPRFETAATEPSGSFTYLLEARDPRA